MKTKISFGIILGLVFAMTFALALSPPLPISGTVTDEGNVDGIDVTIYNTRTGETQITSTEFGGQYLFDWANTNLKYADFDQFQITVRGVTKTITFTGEPIEANFDFTGDGTCPECSVCNTCPTDTTPYSECNSCCPAVPVDTTPYETCDACCIACPEQTPCPTPTQCEADECPVCDTTVASIIAILAGLILGAGGGVNIQIYRNNKGGATLKHKHVGILGYHDINTIHNNLLYRHAKGALTPELPNKVEG
jgi:hypothetical protein